MQISKWNYFFFAFVALYAFCIIYKSSPPLMSGDDALFFMQLQQGEAVWHGVDLANKRFFPLAGWNLNLIALFSTSPYAFMAGNALAFIITAYCYYALAQRFDAPTGLILLSFALLTLSVGYTKIITQIAFSDMTQIMFLMIFLLCAKKIYDFAESKAKITLDSAKLTYICHSERNEVKRRISKEKQSRDSSPTAQNDKFVDYCVDSAPSAQIAESKSYIYIYIYIYISCALLCANFAIYLKEVSFILISGFGFFHLLFCFINHRFFSIPKPSKHAIIFDILLMLSGVIFLVLYVILTHKAQSSYTEIKNVFSPTRTFIVAILSAPLVSICAPLMLVCRICVCLKDKTPLCPFCDTLLIIALCYFMAFLALGMGSFHYFMPSSFLCAIFGVVFLKKYIRRIYKNIVFLGVCAIVGFIFITNAIPQGLHYFSLNKVQMRNLSAGMEFLAQYIRANKGAVLYFDGFCRGRDRCYYFWQYGVIFEILPKLYEAKDFDIKSKEPNGENFTPNPNASFSFYRDDIVSTPKSGDLIIVSFMSDKAISGAYLAEMKRDYELLFVSNNFGYIPSYNLMSFGALLLQKWGVKHALSNMGNPLKMPSQFYVFRVR